MTHVGMVLRDQGSNREVGNDVAIGHDERFVPFV